MGGYSGDTYDKGFYRRIQGVKVVGVGGVIQDGITSNYCRRPSTSKNQRLSHHLYRDGYLDRP